MIRTFGLMAVVLILVGAGCNREAAVPGSQAATPASAPAARVAASVPVERLVQVVISGGHETEGRDRGRPDVLVAAGLGVPTDVFREAFSHVRPAPAGQEPDPQQVQLNKQALMDALGKYGVTNERLDEVSNYYRYPPGDPGLWRHVEAVVKARVVEGKVVGFVVEKAGAGYTTVPEVKVEGFAGLKVEVRLHFGKDLGTNGSIEAVQLGK